MNKYNAQAAKTMGSIAFANGVICVPAFDAELTALIAGRQIGDKRTIADLKAWQLGWIEASLSNA